MPIIKDLLGYKWGRLEVIELIGSRGQPYNMKRFWKCRCSCGNTVELSSSTIGVHAQLSCGCLKREITISRSTKHGQGREGNRTRAYNAWKGMRKRCLNPNEPRYKYYGGRGITIAKRWDDFLEFYKDMGDPPPKTSLDRINNNGNYCKRNCRWSTQDVQVKNRRAPYTNKVDRLKARKIRSALSKGVERKVLASKYGVHIGTISQIARNETWKEERL